MNPQDNFSSLNATCEKLLSRACHLQLISLNHTKNSLLEQQKNVWRQEYLMLTAAEKKLSSDVNTDLASLAFRLDGDEGLWSSLELSKMVDTQLDQYQENVIVPFLLLVTEMRKNAHRSDHIQKLLASASEKCLSIKHILHQELTQINASGKWNISKGYEYPTNVPEEFLELCFPDTTVKVALLSELQALDDKFRSRLTELEENFQRIESVEWKEEDSTLFSHVVNMFPLEMANRKALYMDLLKHLFPQRNLADFEMHKTWKEKLKFHRDQRKKCFADWKRERCIWLMLSKAIFQDERERHRSLLQRRETVMQQKDLCLHLRKKVDQWRSDKAIEDEMLEELQSQWLEMARRVQAEKTKAETLRRSIEREKLIEFYDRQLRKKKERELEEREEFSKVQSLSKKRMQLNRLRVSYRAQLSAEQQIARQKRIAHRKEEEKQEKFKVDKDIKQDSGRV